MITHIFYNKKVKLYSEIFPGKFPFCRGGSPCPPALINASQTQHHSWLPLTRELACVSKTEGEKNKQNASINHPSRAHARFFTSSLYIISLYLSLYLGDKNVRWKRQKCQVWVTFVTEAGDEWRHCLWISLWITDFYMRNEKYNMTNVIQWVTKRAIACG